MFSSVLRTGTAGGMRKATPALGLRCMSALIQPNLLSIEKNKAPKQHMPKETLKFGQSFSDHMLDIDWTLKDGWKAPKIVPYGNLSLSPAASVLHYALECFEGMKAYVDKEGAIRLFRPDMNMRRLAASCDKLMLPKFGEAELLECIKKLVAVDKSWIPAAEGYSLYLRPTMISTHPFIGVAAAQSAKLFVICSPVGPYYPTGFAPVKLLADPSKVRAWPGGTGDAKIGSNYAMGIKAGFEAQAKGFSQILWLFDKGEGKLQVTEVGTMNQFFLWKTREGKTQLVTAALDGTILPGVTRDSVLQLCREWKEFEVVEREYYLHEVLDAVKEGRMIEAFGSGTAAIVSPVEAVHFQGKDYKIPLNPAKPEAKAGALTQRLAETIMGIQYGKIPHKWSVKVADL